jgi:uncharacterized protein
MIEPFLIESRYNSISGIIAVPDGTKTACPCVVLSHGLISSKSSSKYVALSEQLSHAGIASCRFDYHGCGESGGRIEETTLTIRFENLSSVVEHVRTYPGIDPERIGILGSSFGGVTCVLKASRDYRIRCVSPWATPFELIKTGDGSIDEIPFKDEFYSDFLQYDILSEARNVSHALVIHGEIDSTVPCREGVAIYEHLQEPKRLHIIKGADHTFSIPEHRDHAIGLAIDWFRKYLLADSER